MLPALRDVLELPAVTRGEPVVRAGGDQLDQPVRWVHVSEISDIATLLEGGELILATGIALPRSAEALRQYVAELSAVGACGLVVELGRRYRKALPAALVEAARAASLPLVELHRETPFVAVTQAVHTLILDARMREIVASDERQQHRTLLTSLALSSTVPDEVCERSAGLGVPLAVEALTAIAIRPVTADAVAPALLRDIANRAAETLDQLSVHALVAPLDDNHVALVLAQRRRDRVDSALRRLAERVHAVSERPDAPALVIGVGATVDAVATPAIAAAAALREAVGVSDAAAGLPPQQGWVRPADLRLPGLLHQLRDSPHLHDYIGRELGPLLARPDAAALLDTLGAYRRAGGSKTDAAAALFVSRAALYDRLRKIERVLGVDLGVADVVLGLHFAVLAHAITDRPELAFRRSR